MTRALDPQYVDQLLEELDDYQQAFVSLSHCVRSARELEDAREARLNALLAETINGKALLTLIATELDHQTARGKALAKRIRANSGDG